MNFLLLAAVAHADSFKVPDDYTFAEAVAAAYNNSGSDTIDVDATFDGSDEDAVDIGGQELEIIGNGAILPAMYGDGASVKLTEAVLTTMATFEPDPSLDTFDCALCLENSSANLETISIATSYAGDGVVLVDTDAAIADLDVSGLWSDGGSHAQGVGLVVKGLNSAPAVTVSRSSFADTQSMAIAVQGGTFTPSVELHGVMIDDCGSNVGAIALVAADLSMDDSGSTSSITNSGSSAGSYTTIYVYGSTFSAQNTTFTGNGGIAAGLLYSTSGSASFDGCTIGANDSSSGVEIQAENITLRDVTWTAHGSVKTSSSLDVTDSLIDLTDIAGTGFTKWVDSADGPVVLRNNTICGVGFSDRQTTALVSALSGPVGGSLAFDGNIVTQAGAIAGSLFVLDTTTASFHDNTIVDSFGGPYYFSGSTSVLQYENNLVSGGHVDMGLDSVPTGVSDYNLHANTLGPWTGLPSGNDKNSHLSSGLGDPPPGFVSTFDPAVCGSRPELDASSWAIDHGDPAFLDADRSRSDIGAIDFGGGIVDTGDTGTVDTGDTGTVDTGDTGTAETGDTGTVDSADSGVPDTGAADEDGDGYGEGDCDDHDPGVHPGAVDEPGDGLDQDCSGGDADVTWAGGCGCDGGAKLPGGLALLLALGLLRRRSG